MYPPYAFAAFFRAACLAPIIAGNLLRAAALMLTRCCWGDLGGESLAPHPHDFSGGGHSCTPCLLRCGSISNGDLAATEGSLWAVAQETHPHGK